MIMKKIFIVVGFLIPLFCFESCQSNRLKYYFSMTDATNWEWYASNKQGKITYLKQL